MSLASYRAAPPRNEVRTEANFGTEKLGDFRESNPRLVSTTFRGTKFFVFGCHLGILRMHRLMGAQSVHVRASNLRQVLYVHGLLHGYPRRATIYKLSFIDRSPPRLELATGIEPAYPEYETGVIP